MNYVWISLSAFRLSLDSSKAVSDGITCLFSSDFSPSHYGIVDGAVRLRYSPEAIAADIDSIAERGAFIAERRSAPRFEATMKTKSRSYVMLDAAGIEVSRDMVEHWLTASECFYPVARPEFMVVGFGPPSPHDAQRRRTWASEHELAQHLLSFASTLAPKDYYPLGPLGLSLRTYLGPTLVERLGRSTLMSLPAVVTDLGDGALRVDLHENLADAPYGELVDTWRECMARLNAARVFAEPVLDPARGRIQFKRAS